MFRYAVHSCQRNPGGGGGSGCRRLRGRQPPGRGELLVEGYPVRRVGGRGGLDAAGRQPAEHAGCRQPDHQLECGAAGRGVVRAGRVDGCSQIRWLGEWLRDDAGRGEWRGVHPGSRVERDGDQARHRQGLVDAQLQLAERRPGRRQRRRRNRVRGDGQRRGRPVGGHRPAVVEPDPDRQRPRGHRHGPRLQRRHRVRLDRARQPEQGPVPGRRQGDPVGAERRHGRAGMVLGRGAEPVGEPEPQLRRRPVGSAVVRQRRATSTSESRTPARSARAGGPRAIRGGPAGRARTCTPTRSSSSARPASCCGTTSSPRTTCSTGTCRTRRCSPPPTGSRW